MRRLIPTGVGILTLLCATVAYAALPPAYYTNSQTQESCTATAPCGTQGKVITFYVPHGGTNCASSVQGCIETSRVGLDGDNKPISVDAVRLGKAKYATCASDPSNYGKYFNMGTITYRSALDQQQYTVQNVICFVHDTGGAFRGRPDKLDLATTICATCTEAQAHTIGVGGQVNLVGQGPIDTNKNASVFNSALGNMGVVPTGYPTGGTGGQNSGQSYSQQQASNPFSQAVSQLSSQSSSGSSANQSASVRYPSNTQPVVPISSSASTIPPAALLVVQPKSVRHGDPVVVSWSSVGMSTQTLCQVSNGFDSISQKNSGSQILSTTLSEVGTLTFTLSCTTQAGVQTQQTASVTVS